MSDEEDAQIQEADKRELIRLRTLEKERLEAIQKEHEARQLELDGMDQDERDRSELTRLRLAEVSRIAEENLRLEHEQWQTEQNRLRVIRERDRLNQEEHEREVQADKDREDLIRFRAAESSAQSVRPARFSNQFDSTGFDNSPGNLNSSIAQMTQELNKTSSAWSHATLRCNPCSPSLGSDILTRYDFDMWKSEWLSLLDISPTLTEKQKLSLFMRSAGTHLREILTGLSIDSPDESSSLTPYSDMMSRLEKHFNSEANQKLEAMVFRSTLQEPGESNVEFIRRLLKKVRFCGFTNLMFELIATVAQNTTDSRLRLKALDPDCDFSKLMSYATTLQLNSNIEKVKEASSFKQIEVNAVQAQRPSPNNSFATPSGNSYASPTGNSSWSRPSRDPARAQDRNNNRYKQQGSRSRPCYRCGEDASTHQINNCPAFHKICLHCNKKGHVSKACKSKAAGYPAVKKEPSTSLNDQKKPRINELSSNPSLSETASEVSNDDEFTYE